MVQKQNVFKEGIQMKYSTTCCFSNQIPVLSSAARLWNQNETALHATDVFAVVLLDD
jgi:hypothetical protein